MTKIARSENLSALDLLEEAIVLLRRLPFLSFAALFAGSMPFTLAFLLFLLILSHDPAARDEIVGYAGLLALLYVLLRISQTVFAAAVWQARTGASAVTWSVSTLLQVICRHLVYSPLSFVAVLASTVLSFPLAWAYAFHQNLVLLVLPGLWTRERVSRTSSQGGRECWRQARLWSGQNHLLILLISLVGVVLLVNVVSVLLLVPYLVKFMTGWESSFTRIGGRIFNLKLLVAAGALTSLALSPLVKSVYTLRCFYGLSQDTGADLLTEVTNLRVGSKAPKLAVAVLACALLTPEVQAFHLPWAAGIVASPVGNTATAARTAPGLPLPVSGMAAVPAEVQRLRKETGSAETLDRALDQVLKSRKHQWQAPRSIRPEAESGLLHDFGKAVERWFRQLGDWIEKLLKWLNPKPLVRPKSFTPGRFNVKQLANLLIIACALVLAGLLVRMFLDRRASRVSPGPRLAPPVPDLSESEVNPAELPEDGWLALAASMFEKGEVRLAVRAVYLATLALLGERQLLVPARFKSNRDYLRELERKSAGRPAVLTSFEPMVGIFEKVWYGRYAPGARDLEEMRDLLFSLRARSEES